jgi:hypothetical protein
MKRSFFPPLTLILLLPGMIFSTAHGDELQTLPGNKHLFLDESLLAEVNGVKGNQKVQRGAGAVEKCGTLEFLP